MSESEGRKLSIEFPKLDELEAAVGRALRQLEVWRERAAASEAERRRLQAVIDEMRGVSKDLDPSVAAGEIRRLREENEGLRRQLEDGMRQARRLAHEVELLEDLR